MTDNAGVGQQSQEIALSKLRDFAEVEFLKCGSEVLALRKDRAPTKARLKTFQADFLKQAHIVDHWKAPFMVVVGEKFRGGGTPAAARTSIRTGDGCAHASTLRKFSASVVRLRSTS